VVVHGEIAKILAEIDSNRQDAAVLLLDLTDAQFNWKPEAAVWSMAENLTHLVTVMGLDTAKIAGTIAGAKSEKLYSTGPFRYGFLSRWFVRLMEPPPKRRFSAPKIYVPPPDARLVEVMTSFNAALDNLADQVRDSNGLDLARAKVVSPVTRYMRMPLGARFLLMTAHNRRHLWQALQLKKRADFPAAVQPLG